MRAGVGGNRWFPKFGYKKRVESIMGGAEREVGRWQCRREPKERLQRERERESVFAGRVSWGHSAEYHSGMWNAESLPRQTHRSDHRRPQWPSRAALYKHKHAVIYVHENIYSAESRGHIENGCAAACAHTHSPYCQHLQEISFFVTVTDRTGLQWSETKLWYHLTLVLRSHD